MRFRSIGLIASLALVNSAYGIDATRQASIVEKFGHWQVIQFALPRTIVYRISTASISDPKATITMDCSDQCAPRGLVMIMDVRSRGRPANSGFAIFANKVPGDNSDHEDLVTALFSAGFAFYSSKSLNAQQLYATHGAGNLAV